MGHLIWNMTNTSTRIYRVNPKNQVSFYLPNLCFRSALLVANLVFLLDIVRRCVFSSQINPLRIIKQKDQTEDLQKTKKTYRVPLTLPLMLKKRRISTK